jgi:uncharacterized membrane protein
MMLREPWRTRLLFLSFALNLIAIPMIAGRFVMHRPPLPQGPTRPEVIVERMAHELPAEDAARLRAAMEPHLPDIDAARARMEAARAAMSRAIGQTPFDEAAVRAAMHTWQTAWMAWSDDLGTAMLAALAELSPEGRERLAEAGMRHSHR